MRAGMEQKGRQAKTQLVYEEYKQLYSNYII